ncbi:hypothetical protein [Labedaea rhizosphaerae]|uniref:Uncharacterized protein n=1 Tax=Labedaea rhizosphaerae TaxID=598644 RepID=A0A4R6S0T7_LABRH|nr:hypothetical protein [Labedaea rhizosphaerae]TDP92225.1 hypothetical protein EV186_108438 [Labedaea rhizosphaerae]
MTKVLSRGVLVPATTFTLGVVVTVLITDYLERHDPVLFCLAGVLLILVLLVGLTVQVLRSSDKGMDKIHSEIARLISRGGLDVEYVEDGKTGQSYVRATQLIRSAKHSITFVDMWEPFENYQTGTPERVAARHEFYEAIVKQVEDHRGDREMFHRRIVQVPQEFETKPVPFALDPYFHQYLTTIAGLTREAYKACNLRLTLVHVLKTHFIMVDRRHIVIPLLTTDQSSNRQIRHGALFFDDREGNLFKCFREIYRAIDAHARPLTESMLNADPVV